MMQQGYHYVNESRDGVDVYVDRYQLHSNHKGVDVRGQAQMIRTAASVLSTQKRLIAILNQDDKDGLDAYGNEGYSLITMNGDRPYALPSYLTSELKHQKFPTNMVVISSDPAFAPLCSVAAQHRTRVSIWSPSLEVPKELHDPLFEHRQLSELIPSEFVSPGGVHVWLDFENLIIELKKGGGRYDTKQFVQAINTVTEDLGEVKSKTAYADYGLLERDFGNLQHDLERLNVRTRYQVNIRGKNSSDMEIASDIHSAIERDTSIQTVVIGSGDRDFRPTIDVAHARNRRVVILAFRHNLSRDLERAADEVRYLDDYFQIPKQVNRVTTQQAAPSHTHINKLVHLRSILRLNRWQWCFVEKLLEIASEEEWEQAVSAGVLRKGRTAGKATLSFNRDSDLAQAVDYFIPWLTSRVNYLIQDRVDRGKMAYIDTSFLVKGVEMDRKCKSLGIGHSRRNATEWLDAVAAAGCLRKEARPHFKNPSIKVDTWWPVNTDSCTQATSTKGTDQEESRQDIQTKGDTKLKSYH